MVAKENDPDVLLMYNDYGLIRDNPSDMDHREKAILLVSTLIDMGAPVEGLGVQAHLTPPYLPTPEVILRNLDEIASLGLPIYITELDIETYGNESLHARYLRDVLTALYSHPSIQGIIQWGFWAEHHWKPDAALYNENWTPRESGLVFEELMFNEWETHTKGCTDDKGLLVENCFHGDYRIIARYRNHTITKETSVLPDTNNTLIIAFNLKNHPQSFNSVSTKIEMEEYT